MPEPKYTEKDWNEVRTAFASSIMVDTQVSSLAQNLDGPVWPVKNKDETPSKYIDLTYDEAQELLREADARDVLLLMPSGLGNSLYTADAEDEVLRAIDALSSVVAVRPLDVSVWGASMGGAGATTIAFHHPDQKSRRHDRSVDTESKLGFTVSFGVVDSQHLSEMRLRPREIALEEASRS